MAEEQSQNDQVISFSELLWDIPLFDNVFLSMQGQNIMLIDFHIRDLEHELLREYIRIERTPTQKAIFVSAMSQMWIFAVYELLRTWRQFTRQLKSAKGYKSSGSGPINLSENFWKKHERLYKTDTKFKKSVVDAEAAIDPLFGRVERLRMNLAKHEVKGKHGELPASPGYGRIDTTNGSIFWMVDLGNSTVEMTSRRDISEHLRQVVLAES